MFKEKCGDIIIEMHYVGLFIMLMMGKMLKAQSFQIMKCIFYSQIETKRFFSLVGILTNLRRCL